MNELKKIIDIITRETLFMTKWSNYQLSMDLFITWGPPLILGILVIAYLLHFTIEFDRKSFFRRIFNMFSIAAYINSHIKEENRKKEERKKRRERRSQRRKKKNLL